MNERQAATAATDPEIGGRELALKLWIILSRTFAAVQEHAERDVARHGLTIAEFAILEVLYHKGPLLLGEVQKLILVSSGGVTYLVDRLERKGLVERQECPEDRRARYAVLTEEGQALIGRIFPEHAEAISHAMSGLTSEQQREVAGLLRTLGRKAAELDSPARTGD